MSEYEPGMDPFSLSGSTEEMTREDLHKGGGAGVAKPGMYHVAVDSVEFKTDDKTPHVRLIMSVLSGTEESEFGKKVYHRIYFSKKTKEDPDKEQKAFRALVAFLFEFGVLGEDAFNQKNLVINKAMFERLEGCQAIVKVELEKASKYTDSDGSEKMGRDSYKILWNNNVWNLNHEFVKDVQKDWEMAQMVGANQPTAEQLAKDLDGI